MRRPLAILALAAATAGAFFAGCAVSGPALYQPASSALRQAPDSRTVGDPLTVGDSFSWPGTYTGTIDQPNPQYTYPATATFVSRRKASITYGAPFNCSGTWKFLSRNKKTFSYHEHISHQGGLTCVTDGTVYLTIVDANTLSYVYGNQFATGTLTRQ